MAIKAGVWIDHKQAVMVLLTNAGKEIKRITSDIGKPVRSARNSRLTKPDRQKYFVAEDTLERRFESQLQKYYDEVIACLRGAEAILILGPGEAKGEIIKRIKGQKLRGRVVEVETADKMTDRQVAGLVAKHFAMISTNKSRTSQKAARKKAAASASGERTKKATK